jgi:hypothetical protein
LLVVWQLFWQQWGQKLLLFVARWWKCIDPCCWWWVRF